MIKCIFGSMHGKSVDWTLDTMQVPTITENYSYITSHKSLRNDATFKVDTYVKREYVIKCVPYDIYILSTIDWMDLTQDEMIEIEKVLNDNIWFNEARKMGEQPKEFINTYLQDHTHFTKESVQEYGEHCRTELLKAGFTPKKGVIEDIGRMEE